MKKHALVFGGIAGGLILVYSFVVFLVLGSDGNMNPDDFAKAEVFGYLRYIILLLAVVMGMRAYSRQSALPVSYGKALLTGVLVAAVVGIGVGLMEAVYIALNPDFMSQYGDAMIANMRRSGSSEAQIKALQQEMEAYRWMANPALAGIFYFFETAIIGTLGALVAAAFFRKPGKPVVA